VSKDFTQIEWDEQVADDCRHIVRLAVREDLDRSYDWTTMALVSADSRGRANIVARQPGVIAGVMAARCALTEMEIGADWREEARDGDSVGAGDVIVQISGPARDLLTAERLLLNLIGRLSGIATLTRRYVEAVAGARARIYDTRKTTPAWRRLEKHAVRCGGGNNHRTGLFDAILIKDNHLAVSELQTPSPPRTLGEVVEQARRFVQDALRDQPSGREMIIEVEVDTLEQLEQVLPAHPDIVLLDNMPPQRLREAVALRDKSDSATQLEASGGVTLDSVREIALSGVERISVGALTHSAVSLNVGMDWLSGTND
jgi:nicotinate-nucleotide pyrophosphorylase (carboxylating)